MVQNISSQTLHNLDALLLSMTKYISGKNNF